MKVYQTQLQLRRGVGPSIQILSNKQLCTSEATQNNFYNFALI